jgi:hypothetical protein
LERLGGPKQSGADQKKSLLPYNASPGAQERRREFLAKLSVAEKSALGIVRLNTKLAFLLGLRLGAALSLA